MAVLRLAGWSAVGDSVGAERYRSGLRCRADERERRGGHGLETSQAETCPGLVGHTPVLRPGTGERRSRPLRRAGRSEQQWRKGLRPPASNTS